MRITKLAHACVRIEHDGTTVVIDPGVFVGAEVLDGADAVLITHEHFDHYVADTLRESDARVFTVAGVAARIHKDAPDVAERVTVVAPGETFDVGLPVRAVGELHAMLHPSFPPLENSGYVLTLGDQKVYHPGDALTEPGEDIDVLLVPSSAPWLKTYEAIEFARAVKAPRNLAIHDRIYSDAGHGFLEMQMNLFLPDEGMEYLRRADGEDL